MTRNIVRGVLRIELDATRRTDWELLRTTLHERVETWVRQALQTSMEDELADTGSRLEVRHCLLVGPLEEMPPCTLVRGKAPLAEQHAYRQSVN